MYENGEKIVKKIQKKLKKKKKKKTVINNQDNQNNQVNLEIKDIDQQIKCTEDEFNLSKEGRIEFAKIHTLANRPLHQKGEFNTDTKFCPCCNLPAEQENILIPFKFCENTDKFAECGEGIFLYFSFFKFGISSLLVASIIIGTSNIYLNYRYTNTIMDFCNDYFKDYLIPYNDTTFLDECKIYFTEADKDSEYYIIDNQFFFQFSTVNIKNYRKIYQKINLIYDQNINFENSIFNLSLINYICLLAIFVYNLLYIYYLYNKKNSVNFRFLRQSDYSVFINNLYDVHKRFLDIKKEINERRAQSQKDGGTTDNYEYDYKEKLGIDIPLSELKNESEEFKFFLKNKICKGNYNEYNLIDNIVLCSKMDKYKKLENNIEEIARKINKIKFDDDIVDFNKEKNLEGDERKLVTSKFSIFCFHFFKKEEKLGELKKRKEEMYKELDNLFQDTKNNTINYFAGSAFVTFSSLKEQELFLKNFKFSFFQNCINFIKNTIYMLLGSCLNKDKKPILWLKRYVNFEQADEPSDIIFENLEFKKISKIIRTFVVYVISFFIAIFSNSICFMIIAGLNALLDYINKKFKHPIVQYLTSLVISFASTILNYIYENIFHILTKFEKQTTWTKYYLSYSIKLTIFSFINSGILPLLGEIYHPSDGHKTLINNMLMMFLLNSILTPLLWTLNISYFKNRIKICLLERMKDPDDEHGLTQKELNDLYELPPMNISIKYSYIAKTLLMAFLYIPIFPLGILISFFGFCFTFLLEKFNFCNIYKKPEMIGEKICKFYIDYFVIALFVYGLGDYFFLKETYNNNIWSLVSIITFGAFIFIPYIKLLNRDYLNINKCDFYQKEYKDCLEFMQDYERANPINKKEGKINYLKKLKEKEIITENELNNYIKDIYNVNIMQIFYKNKHKMKDSIKKYSNIINNNINNLLNNNDNLINNDNNLINSENNNDNNLIINDNNLTNNNNVDLSSNINININNNKTTTKKKIIKKKKKSLIIKPLDLNQVNDLNSNSKDVYNNFGDSINQKYEEI